MPPALRPDRRLGRIRPLAQYAHGRFRAVVGSGGKTRYFARFDHHYDQRKDQAPPPPAVDWTEDQAQVVGQMYLNDQLGDCVIASRQHAHGIWTGNARHAPVLATDAETAANYAAACGPGDNGCDMSAVCQYQQQTGLVMAGQPHKIAGAVAIDWTNQLFVQVALEVFGSIDLGLALPVAWYQSNNGDTWDVVTGADAEVVGGHEVQAVGYDATGVKILTWGGTRTVTWAALAAPQFFDEAYTALSVDWEDEADVAPNGIDAATLAADLKLAASGQVPPLGPVPVPPPAPVAPPAPSPPVPVAPPVPPAPVPPPPVATGALTGTVTGSLPLGPLGEARSVSLTLKGTVTLPAGAGPNRAEQVAFLCARSKPTAISWQQWVQVVTAIIDVVNQIINPPAGKPKPATVGADAVAARVKCPDAALSPAQWLQIIEDALQIILPIILGGSPEGYLTVRYPFPCPLRRRLTCGSAPS